MKVIREFTEELLPEIFKFLKEENDPMVGVHFSRGLTSEKPSGDKIKIGNRLKREPHLGLNKHPAHGDPIGIYTFPKNYVLNGGLEKNGFFSSSEYFYIIKPIRSKCKILNLSEIKDEELKDILEKMDIPNQYLTDDSVYHRSTKEMKPGHKLWGIIEKFRSDGWGA